MGVSRPTEMTVRDLLQEELRRRGVTVVPEFSVSTPTGVLKPDILLRVLGFGDDEINRVLDYFYPALAKEIQQPINPHARINRFII